MSAYGDHMLEAAFQAYRAGRFASAEALLRLVVGRCGNDAHALYFIGHLAYQQGRPDDAAWFLTRSLAIRPDQARAHNDLGETLRALGRNEDALPHLQRAIALEPSLSHAYGNLATVLVALNRPEDALRHAQESLRRGSDKAVAHCDLGSVFGRLNRTQEAIRQYDLALALEPGNARARYFRGLMRLTLGIMPDAWEGHEARLELPTALAGTKAFGCPRWTGEPHPAGRTILLHAEQGFGDTIQFIRYVPLVEALGFNVIVEVQRGLGTLLQTIGGRVAEAGDALPAFDLHCPLMSLPAAFATDLASIPAKVPYLVASPGISAAWARTLGPWRKMRVGLAWSGSPGHAADASRSMPLDALAPLLNRGDIECHVVQRDLRDSDRRIMREFPNLADHSAALTDFGQTAGLLAQMDLIVTVDTVVAHLAGALAIPAWVMLAHAADWRWMRDRDDSPWYPSVRLFRQKRRGDWPSVLEPVARNLDQWAIRRG
jgi:tetratricopeptide (TPR) repeat protein